MSDIRYREANKEDIPLLAQIRAKNSGSKEYWNLRISGYWNYAINPQKALKPRIIYIASDQDKIIGFVAGHLTQRFECEGELEWIDVIEQYRIKGIASELVMILANWFITQKAYKICIDPGDETARKFYSKNGAEALDEHWMYWKDIRNIIQNE